MGGHADHSRKGGRATHTRLLLMPPLVLLFLLGACGHGTQAAPDATHAGALKSQAGCGCSGRKDQDEKTAQGRGTCRCKQGRHKLDSGSTPDLAPIPFKIWEDAHALEVRSSDFKQRTSLPLVHTFNQFGCSGDNTAPSLAWSPGPEDTQSYAVVAFDPDAPTGVGFFHLLVYNIGKDVTQLDPSSLPPGAAYGRNDYGATGYGGPCPPKGHGAHRYVFSVYALNAESLDLGEAPSGALLRFMIKQHAVAAGHIVGYYGR